MLNKLKIDDIIKIQFNIELLNC